MPYLHLALALSLGCGLIGGCSQEAETTHVPTPRPVTVLELSEIDPIKPLQLTGSVKAWKEQDVAFEVDGRVAWIVEMGTQLDAGSRYNRVNTVPRHTPKKICSAAAFRLRRVPC